MTTLITVPAAGEMTIISFYRQMGSQLSEASRHLLNLVARSLVERGWIQSLDAIVEQLVEHGDDGDSVRAAIADLAHRRLLTLDATNARVTGLLGSVSVARTACRAHLSNGVDIFALGGMDLLSMNTLFARSVHSFCQCGQCSADISLTMEDEAVTSVSPSGVAGFQASWDGEGPLAAVSANSPLLCSDACLSDWQDAHPDVDGLPISADLLLHVGTMMANESGGARFEMVRAAG